MFFVRVIWVGQSVQSEQREWDVYGQTKRMASGRGSMLIEPQVTARRDGSEASQGEA